MNNKTKMAIIGLGARGYSLLDMAYLEHPDVEFIAVCDVYADRAKAAADLIEKRGFDRPVETMDYKDILAMDEIEAVVIATSWDNHIDMSIEFMRAGKYVACEVGGAYSVRDCWKLVDAYEETGVPIMMLENCVYGRDEMMLMNMLEQGVLGEIIHCDGAYAHDLRDEIAFGVEKRHYRLDNYIHRNTENYPTHELGPIARLLKINRGNRLVSLTSTSSKACGLSEYVKEHKSDDGRLMNTPFNQGDIVTTVIKCANGETIKLTLDTTLPRAYSRGLVVRSTKAMYNEDNHSLFLEGDHTEKEHFKWKEFWGNVEKYREKYDHPMWIEYLKDGVKLGHDGMDYLVFDEFVKSVRAKIQVPIDVYDMATWMSITALADESIALGSKPVYIPDFTNGKWIHY